MLKKKELIDTLAPAHAQAHTQASGESAKRDIPKSGYFNRGSRSVRYRQVFGLVQIKLCRNEARNRLKR